MTVPGPEEMPEILLYPNSLDYQYLYQDGEDFVFMNNSNYEQVNISPSLVEKPEFLTEGMICSILFHAEEETLRALTGLQCSIKSSRKGHKLEIQFNQTEELQNFIDQLKALS